jgi:hypothetical protein
MPRYSDEAKERERQTRAQLGPRLGHPKPGGHRVTAPERIPRATGVPRGAAHAEPNPQGD